MLVNLKVNRSDVLGLSLDVDNAGEAGTYYCVPADGMALGIAKGSLLAVRLRQAYRLLVAGHVQDGIARLDAVLEEIGEIE